MKKECKRNKIMLFNDSIEFKNLLMKICVWILLISGFLVSSFLVFGQTNRVAQSGMTFLDIDIGARPAAMGGSFICMDQDVNTLFWNPAGIARMKGFEFSVNETSWFADMKEYALGMVFGTHKYGSIGLSFLIIDNPDVHVTTISYGGGEKWEDEGFQDIIHQHALGITYAKQISDLFSVGGQVKWVHEDLGSFQYEPRARADTDSGFSARKNLIAYDFGTQYYTGFKDLRVALSIRHFAPRNRYQLDYFEPPVNFRFGIAMNILSIFIPDDDLHSLTLCVDAIHPRDFSERVQIGCEYWFGHFFALRAGYKFNHDLESFAGGIGVRKKLGTLNIKIDYAYSAFGGIFDDIQRISFGISK
jgi:hypothetical protein